MGSGKSVVGQELARLLGWRFRDLDQWIEQRQRRPIRAVFAEEGEAFFREQERKAALATQRLRRHVVAAGGGAFAFPATRAALRRGAVTVWLRCSFAVLARRVQGDPSRPLAASRAKMQRLLRERMPFYRLADLAVDTARSGPAAVARRIAALLWPAVPPPRRRGSR
jgi:shikimate kinase